MAAYKPTAEDFKSFEGTHGESSYNPSPEDFEENESNNKAEPAELTGLTGVGSDIFQSLSKGLSNAKNFASDIPNKLEKRNKYEEEHPLSSYSHGVGQLVASLADIGKEFINSPYNLNQYLARKHLLPQVLGKLGKFIPHLPEDTGIENALGLKADPSKGDDLIRSIPEIGAALAGVGSVGKGVKGFFKGHDLKESIRQTQEKVNKATSEAGKIFDAVENKVEEKGISKVPIDKDLIKQAQSFLAKTPANKELIKQARAGNYKALRSLQTDLRVKGEKALSSALSADNKLGEEILSTRDQVNKSIQNHLESTGHDRLAKSLNKARSAYKNIQDTYFSTPALAKVFGKSQRVPKNPKTLLTEESTEMKRFMSAHPEVKATLSKALKHENKIKNLKRVGKALGIGTSAEVAHEVLNRK